MNWQSFLAEIAWKGTVILAAALAAGAVLRRASAALRHLVWTVAFAALVALPVVTLMLPKWSPRAVTAAPAELRSVVLPGTGVHVTVTARRAPTWDPVPWFWLTGCAATAGWFLLGAARTWRMVRRSTGTSYAQEALDNLRYALGIGRRVRAIESAETPVPLTWGTLRPVVVLPPDASGWPQARLDAVLLHELIHVRRLDLLAQIVAQAACCLYWFHPAAWFALRQFRRERERACDDAVLLRGLAAHDYAGHLMGLVRDLAARRAPWADAPAMAEFSDFESRVRALLDHGRRRGPVTRRAAAAAGALACAVLLPLAVITAHPQTRGALAGVVEDASGARVPNCRVTAVNLDGSNQEVTQSNAAGEYGFGSIPPGRYTVSFMSPGFAMLKIQAQVMAGAAARADGKLELGSMMEHLSVTGRRPAAQPAPVAGTPQRIRVGGNVQMSKLIRQARPVYPPELQNAGVEGTVILRAVVSVTGDLLNVEVVNTNVNPGLAQAALDAVRQWRYQPTLLNGQPVEVVTTITVDFKLE